MPDPETTDPKLAEGAHLAARDQATAAAFDLGTIIRSFYNGLGDMDEESAAFLSGEYMQAQIALGNLANREGEE
jgi:hypothetical protein